MTTPAPPSTYSEYFATNDLDPFAGDYVPLMAEFRTENNPPVDAALYTTVASADPGYPAAFLAVIEDSPAPAGATCNAGLRAPHATGWKLLLPP